MPAGDAGFPIEAQGECAFCAEIDRLRERLAEWESAHSVTVELRGLIESHMDMARGQWQCVAQLAAQQAVVDAARAFDAVLSDYCDGPERDQLRAVLDKAQAAQPEGERAR